MAYIKLFNLLILFSEGYTSNDNHADVLTDPLYSFSLLTASGKWRDRWEVSSPFLTLYPDPNIILKVEDKTLISCSFKVKIVCVLNMTPLLFNSVLIPHLEI